MNKLIKYSIVHFVAVVALSMFLGFMALGYGFSDNQFAKQLLTMLFYFISALDLPASWLYYGVEITDWKIIFIQAVTSVFWVYVIVKALTFRKRKRKT
jgi:hypothetical protein